MAAVGWLLIVVAAAILTALGMRAEIRDARRAIDEAAEADWELADSDYLAPHAKWLSQHDIDRQFNAIAAAEEARQ